MQKLQKILSQIEENFGFKIKNYKPAQRGYVAETFVLTDEKNETYFLKITDKPLFIKTIVKSLPVLEDMYKNGLKRICYPIRSKAGLHFHVGDTLVVLFNHIDAPQSYDYYFTAFGELIGNVHKITSKVKILPEKEMFNYKEQTHFDEELEGLFNLKTNDSIMAELIKLLKKYEKDIRSYMDCFLELLEICYRQKDQYEYVITHNDAGGNTLVKSKDDLYLIDWDDILLAPRERDIWVMSKFPDFLKGYKNINPNYQINQDLHRFYTYKYFFNCMQFIIADIKNKEFSENKRREFTYKWMEAELLKPNSWFYPYLRNSLKPLVRLASQLG
jgi:hypothetical protein